MDAFPAELVGLFPNVEVLLLNDNRLCTLPREVGQLQRLRE
jgi:hypothetical protein